MSDPVTNLAIEDVLSSIRRLVSEGDRAPRPGSFDQLAQSAGDAPRAPERQVGQQAHDVEGKLVLTPAFRVADFPAALSRAADTMATSVNAANPPIAFVRPSVSSTESRSALELRIAELEAAVTDQADDWEPDGSEDVPVVDWSSPEVGESLIFASRAMPQTDRRGVLDLGQVGTRIHPVLVEDEPLAVDPYDVGEDLDLSSPDLEPEDIGDDLGDTAMLDQDALRQLVVEIVRQELQGPMGERITRNVRKMVRREIYRILSSQEFES